MSTSPFYYMIDGKNDFSNQDYCECISQFHMGEVVAFIPQEEVRILGCITSIIFTPQKVKYTFLGIDGLMIEAYSQRFDKLTAQELVHMTDKVKQSVLEIRKDIFG